MGRIFLISAVAVSVCLAAVTFAEERPNPAIRGFEEVEGYGAFDPLRDRYFGDFRLSTSFHGRLSGNTSENLVDLTDKLNDGVTYIGYQYTINASLRHTSSAELFLSLIRDNISNYDAPAWTDRRLITLFGERHTYTEGEILPRVYKLYTDLPITDFLDTRLRVGIFPYQVGNGYALGGKYPDLGVNISFGPEYLRGRLHYHRVDWYNKQTWGPHINQDDEDAFSGKHTNADQFAADLMAKIGRHTIQPYISFFHDYTSPKYRNNIFDNFNLNGTRFNNDLLGTVGIDVNLNFERFNFGIEYARNFGTGYSSNKTAPDRGDIEHKGWLVVADTGYNLGLVRPKGKFVWASGNKASRSDTENFITTTRTNRTFSVYTPTNAATFDANYQRAGIGPYLATASTWLFNYGIDRPGIFNDPYVVENVIFLNGGFEFFPLSKLYVSLDYWNMHADNANYGVSNTGAVIKLPSELGHEIDLFASYEIVKHLSVNLQGGYFIPGKYYHQKRGETGVFVDRGNLGFSPVLPRDGKGNPDPAFLIALGFEIDF